MAKRKRNYVFVGAAKWDCEMEDRFVELWQQNPCLYDVSSKDYHDKVKKDKCWRQIAEELQQPVGEVQTKAASLRTQYGKLVRPKPSGSSNKELTSRQKWILNNLLFLQPFVVHRVPPSSLNLDELELGIPEVTDEGEDQEIEEDVSESSTSTLHLESKSTLQASLETSSHHHHQITTNDYESSTPRSKARQSLKDKTADELEAEKIAILKTVSETLVGTINDVDQTFGKQVVTEMKLIKDPLTKMRLRRDILMMLYDAQENELSMASL